MWRSLFSAFVFFTLHISQDAIVSGEVDNSTTTSSTTTSSTTTSSTSTTAKPTPPVPPAPTVPVYIVRNQTDICLLVQMNLQLGVTYFNKKGEPLIQNFYINSTSNFPVYTSGNCANNNESLLLNWWPGANSNDLLPAWSLGFYFYKRSDGHFGLDFIDFNYTLTDELFPDTNDTLLHFVSHNGSQFHCPVGSFYQCMAKQSSKLTKSPYAPEQLEQPEVFVTLSNLKAEAFRTGNATDFVGSVSECSADYVPNKVVPIVVGVVLAVMIVIALLTFVIGSRRRQQGYQEI